MPRSAQAGALATSRGRPAGSAPAIASFAWLFDLDGVLTDTARLHDQAWKAVFDDVLTTLGPEAGGPFDPVRDYERYVDGKPHADGVRDFLAARGVRLPEGGPADPPGSMTVEGVAARKNARYLELLRTEGASPFPDASAFLDAVRSSGARAAVVTASENCDTVLRVSGLQGRFDVQVDGVLAKARRLRGKPAPDTYLEAASMLQVSPADAAVVEDAPAGVAAGLAGGFGLVVGVARRAPPEDLVAAGANVVVRRLTELIERRGPGEGKRA